MSDYIKREDAIRQIVKTSAQNELDIHAIGTVIYILSEMDSADVRENVRGAWLKGEYYSNGYKEEWIFPYCSICHYETDKMYKFCPNCGADMRSES